MNVCHGPRFLYSIPAKTGSSSICQCLEDDFGSKRIYGKHSFYWHEKYLDYQILLSVRNPFARAISLWGFFTDVTKVSFEEFIFLPDVADGYEKFWYCLPQTEWADYLPRIDHILYLETIKEDYNSLPFVTEKRDSIPVMNKTGSSVSYIGLETKDPGIWHQHFTPRAIGKVRELYLPDFDRWGYSIFLEDAIEGLIPGRCVEPATTDVASGTPNVPSLRTPTPEVVVAQGVGELVVPGKSDGKPDETGRSTDVARIQPGHPLDGMEAEATPTAICSDGNESWRITWTPIDEPAEEVEPEPEPEPESTRNPPGTEPEVHTPSGDRESEWIVGTTGGEEDVNQELGRVFARNYDEAVRKAGKLCRELQNGQKWRGSVRVGSTDASEQYLWVESPRGERFACYFDVLEAKKS